MKKIIIAIISVVLIAAVLFGIAMLTKKHKEDTALETADTVVNVSNEMGSVTVSESVAREMLGYYPIETLGISQQLNQYIFKLSSVRIFDQDACRVELYLTESDTEPQAVFAILGYDCFVYDKQKDEYLLLTLNGAFEVEGTTKINPDSDIFYDVDNNAALHKIIDKFPAESLGLPKAPAEFVMVATGTSVVADDGETVYIVKMYEQDGTATNYTCAFAEKKVYCFDTQSQKYVRAVP